MGWHRADGRAPHDVVLLDSKVFPSRDDFGLWGGPPGPRPTASSASCCGERTCWRMERPARRPAADRAVRPTTNPVVPQSEAVLVAAMLLCGGSSSIIGQ